MVGRSHQRLTLRALSTVTALLVAVLAGACAGDDGDPDPRTISAATYAAVIAEFLPPSEATPDGDEDRPVVYVAPLADPLSLEDQVAVIDAVAENYDLRFVDELSAAIELEGGDGAPRDDALVLAIGRIPAESPHTVRVEVYPRAAPIRAELVTVVVAGTDADGAVVWRVDNVEAVDPEGLIGDG